MSQVRHRPRVWAASLLFSAPSLAHVNTATIYGTVTDPSGSAFPQAAINAANQQTGGSWSTVTNAQCEYTLTFLPAGLYTITTKGAGFKESRNTGIELSGGQELRLKYAMALGEVTETVTVSAETPPIHTPNAEQSLNLNLARVKELPTANRDWSSLLNLGTGMTVGNNAVSMDGLPQDGFRFTVDGANASGSGESESLTSLGYIKAVSLEAVREVTVTSGIAPAETGPTMSGNVNVITKSGTNGMHGSLFESDRIEDVAAPNQFLTTRPPVTFNQFGGSIGGPVIKNKLFYFGVFEVYRSRAFTAVSGNVPTGEFRALATAANPAMKTFLDTFPLPNSSYDAGAATGFYQSAASGVEDSNHYSVRADYMATDRDMLSVRYTYDTPFQLTPRVSPQNTRAFDVTTHKGGISYIHSGAGYSAETGVGHNRFERARLDHIFTLGVSAITGSRSFSNSGELMENLGIDYSFDQIVALTCGRHSIKFGGLFQALPAATSCRHVQFAEPYELLRHLRGDRGRQLWPLHLHPRGACDAAQCAVQLLMVGDRVRLHPAIG